MDVVQIGLCGMGVVRINLYGTVCVIRWHGKRYTYNDARESSSIHTIISVMTP